MYLKEGNVLYCSIQKQKDKKITINCVIHNFF